MFSTECVSIMSSILTIKCIHLRKIIEPSTCFILKMNCKNEIDIVYNDGRAARFDTSAHSTYNHYMNNNEACLHIPTRSKIYNRVNLYGEEVKLVVHRQKNKTD